MQSPFLGSGRFSGEAADGSTDGSRRGAVIDIGSNTIHLLVADCFSDGIRPIRDLRVRAKLGIAVADRGALGNARIRAAAAMVRRFAGEARASRARDILVVGTHAVRAAADRGALADAVKGSTGLSVHVLSPHQEAMLCLAGAALGPLPEPPFLSVDIGGGSCDVSAVDASGVEAVNSLAVGSGVLAARNLAGDPPSRGQLDRTTRYLTAMFRAALPGREDFPEVVATGGAARGLQRQVFPGRGPEAGWASDLLELNGWLLRTPSSMWPHPVKGGRAATARAGGLILQTIVIRWRVTRWRVSHYGLREGALARWGRGLGLDAVAAPDARPRGFHGEGGSDEHHRS